ncbi:MAG: helix-turn-helix domain-containing protein [Anaerolineae bacterium]|nr:helix-turn-helix domain-containing protein [Anaerolineae bacterium]
MRNDRLRELRKGKGLSQEALAEQLGLSGAKEIWRYENGETEPLGEKVRLLAMALETSADYLLGLTDDPEPYAHEDMRADELSTRERRVISALRRGEKLEAIRVIAEAD